MMKTAPVLFLVSVTACSASPASRTGWSSSMARVFSNDSVRPDQLPREYWSARDEELLLRRLGLADVAMIGTLRVVSQYIRGSVASQLTLVFRPDELLHGEVDRQVDGAGELILHPQPGTAEFRRCRRGQRDLPGTRYLLFLKRLPDGSSRWALYLPRPRLLDEVRSRYAWLRQRHAGGQAGSL